MPGARRGPFGVQIMVKAEEGEGITKAKWEDIMEGGKQVRDEIAGDREGLQTVGEGLQPLWRLQHRQTAQCHTVRSETTIVEVIVWAI